MEKPQPYFQVVAPIFPVTNLKASVDYYTKKLQFSIGFEWADEYLKSVRYVILNKDETELHLTLSENPHKTAA
ncbi:MAG: VOC family protein [Cyanobacteria bacterium J06592_8]